MGLSISVARSAPTIGWSRFESLLDRGINLVTKFLTYRNSQKQH